MKQIITSVLILSSATIWAQDVSLDKETNMVKVDDKETFYLTPKNKQFMESDYSLEDLSHKELAYLKFNKYSSNVYYTMVFTKSGNQCTLGNLGTFGTQKHLAKMIAGANLVQNNEVSPEEERKFVILHGGTYVSNTPPPPAAPAVPVAAPQQEHKVSQPADISVKGVNIYNNSELVGMFKTSKKDNVTTISVYNGHDVMVCRATHPDDNENADWELTLDGKTVMVLYNPTTPLERLFKYLAEKGYL